MNLNTEPTEPTEPTRRYLSVADAEHALQPLDRPTCTGFFIDHKNPYLGGVLRFEVIHYSREDIKKEGHFDDKGYVMGETELATDIEAADRGLYALTLEFTNRTARIDPTRPIHLALIDDATSEVYRTNLLENKDEFNEDEPETKMTSYNWQKQNDDRGSQRLLLPISKVKNLKYVFERYDASQGGEVN